MAMTNAERQALFQQRRKERIEQCVTAEDVVRACRLIWEQQAADPCNRIAETWDEFVARCRTKRGRDDWMQFLPDDADPDAYDEPFSDAERGLLARVGRVVSAVKMPPENSSQ